MQKYLICVLFILANIFFANAIVETRYSVFSGDVSFQGCVRAEGAFDIRKGVKWGPDFVANPQPTDTRYKYDPKQRPLDPTLWIQVCEPKVGLQPQEYQETFRFDGANGGVMAVGYKLSQFKATGCQADWVITPWGEWKGKNSNLIGPQGDAGIKGIPGVKGDQGPQGKTGDKGPQGTQGPKGPKGVPGVVAVQGPAGGEGNKGDPGPDGPKGNRGTQGPQGSVGVVGVKGEKGDLGPTGPVGPKGPQGQQGPQGPLGPVGDVGPQGSQGGRGPVGDVGPKGDVGPVGPKGFPGNNGDPGDSSTGLKGDKGDEGFQGDPGQKGEKGPDVQGTPGPAGGTQCVLRQWRFLFRAFRYRNDLERGLLDVDYSARTNENLGSSPNLDFEETYRETPMCAEACDNVFLQGQGVWKNNRKLGTPEATLQLTGNNDYYWVLPNVLASFAVIPGDSRQVKQDRQNTLRSWLCPRPQYTVGWVTSFVARSSADIGNTDNRCLAYLRIDIQGRVLAYRIGVCQITSAFANAGSFDYFSHLDFTGLSYRTGISTVDTAQTTTLQSYYLYSINSVTYPTESAFNTHSTG